MHVVIDYRLQTTDYSLQTTLCVKIVLFNSFCTSLYCSICGPNTRKLRKIRVQYMQIIIYVNYEK